MNFGTSIFIVIVCERVLTNYRMFNSSILSLWGSVLTDRPLFCPKFYRNGRAVARVFIITRSLARVFSDLRDTGTRSPRKHSQGGHRTGSTVMCSLLLTGLHLFLSSPLRSSLALSCIRVFFVANFRHLQTFLARP